MSIDVNAAGAEYVQKTSQSSDKLVRKYLARTDKLAKASSDAAQNSFKLAMADPKVIARRQNNLKKLSEEDLNKGMREKGAAAYAAGTAAGADTWARRVAPYFAVIDGVVNTLPARGRGARENVMNRVIPVAEALQKKKESMG